MKKKIPRKLNHPFLEGINSWIYSHKKIFIFGLFFALLFALFTDTMKALLVMVVFGVASSVVVMYKRVIRMPPALELITLTTVMVTIFYGPVVGVLYTIAINMISEVFSGYPDAMSLTYIPSRTFQVLFVYGLWNLTDVGIVALGIYSVIAFNIVQQPMFMFLTDTEQRLKALYFIFLNIPLNILIFQFLGVPVFNVMENITS